MRTAKRLLLAKLRKSFSLLLFLWSFFLISVHARRPLSIGACSHAPCRRQHEQ